MAKLRLPHLIERLDTWIDKEVYSQTDRGTATEFALLAHLQTAVNDHFADRLANAGANYTAPEPELEPEVDEAPVEPAEVVEDEAPTAE